MPLRRRTASILAVLSAVPAAALRLPQSATGPLSGSLPSSFALPRGKSVILFDGVCNFCNRWVNFVLDNDPDGVFVFASMQSQAGRDLLEAVGRPPDDLSTFVMIDSEGFWTQSTAALRVAKSLPVPALNTLGVAFMPLPSFVRDKVYETVATNRYSILGRQEDDATPSCILRDDAAAVQERFLDVNWPLPS